MGPVVAVHSGGHFSTSLARRARFRLQRRHLRQYETLSRSSLPQWRSRLYRHRCWLDWHATCIRYPG